MLFYENSICVIVLSFYIFRFYLKTKKPMAKLTAVVFVLLKFVTLKLFKCFGQSLSVTATFDTSLESPTLGLENR